MTLTSPGPTLGVVGGGQLGRMLGEAAAPLGVEVVVVDPTPDAPAAPVVRDQIVGGFDDPEAVRELAERADVLTYEIELADPDLLAEVGEATDTPVHPDPATLRTVQDKLREKERLDDHGVGVPRFRRVDSLDDLRAALGDLGYPAMLKARRGGYDGRGNVPVESPEDVEPAFEAVGGAALVEAFVDFDRELSVIGVKGADGPDTFPVTETIHEEEILRETVTPARAPETVRARARAVAHDVLGALDGRGVFGIELFEADGEVLVNEIAPRPHNSGHWTIEGALTSQFEQHVRAVLGRPLGATGRRCPTATANVLGDVSEPAPAALRGVDEVLAAPGVRFHWYGKREVRPLRKMGHITAIDVAGDAGGVGDAEDAADLLAATRELRDTLTFRAPSRP